MVLTYKIAMIDFTNLTDIGKKISNNAYKVVKEQFSWDTISKIRWNCTRHRLDNIKGLLKRATNRTIDRAIRMSITQVYPVLNDKH